MNKEEMLTNIREKAALIKEKRKDPRYQKVMGFLVAKGFLHTNEKIHLRPNARIKIEDAVWAGKYVEPRILEVLPAAVMRLQKHFDLNTCEDHELKNAVKKLVEKKEGQFYGVDLKKIEPWLNLKLKDGRVKKMVDKKIMKSFRLRPETIETLESLKNATGKSEAEIIEKLVAGEGLEPPTPGL